MTHKNITVKKFKILSSYPYHSNIHFRYRRPSIFLHEELMNKSPRLEDDILRHVRIQSIIFFSSSSSIRPTWSVSEIESCVSIAFTVTSVSTSSPIWSSGSGTSYMFFKSESRHPKCMGGTKTLTTKRKISKMRSFHSPWCLELWHALDTRRASCSSESLVCGRWTPI